jgi:protein-S-isoprenylcysteine O-methyltransferase Ste14
MITKEKKMTPEERDHPNVIAPPPFINLAGLVLGLLLSLIFPVDFLPLTLRLVLGIPLIGLAAAGLLVAFRAMTRAGTPLDPRETPKLILTTGIYRLSRNPIYLSMGIFVLGVGILADTLWVVVLAPVIIFVMERGVIAREEKYLERKFGATYLQYKAAVRRWI